MSLHPPLIDRVQTSARMERRLVKVLKEVAELRNVSLGELLEGIVFHVVSGRLPFDAEELSKVGELMVIHGLLPAGLPTPGEE